MRGKSGRAVGTLVQLLVTLKGLPLTYNKDLQEDKEGYFHAVDDALDCLQLSAEMLATLTIRPERLRAAVADPLLLATDLADHLTKRGLPFREAHHVTGAAVKRAEALGVDLVGLPLQELQALEPRITAGVYEVLTPDSSVRSRRSYGGTAPEQVRAQIARWKDRLA